MPDNIKLIIFDLDGTLVNAYLAVARSINYTMKKLGLPARDCGLICRSVGWGDSILIRGFVGDGLFDKAIRIYRAHHKEALKTGTRFLPGAHTLLKNLKKEGYVLAIATNRPSRFTRIILKHLKMQDYFDYVLCADKVEKGKPDPAILKQVLKRFCLKPKEALYVGDMVIDVEAGRRAGIKTVAVVTGSCTMGELKKLKPYRVIKKISRLTDIINTTP